MIHCESCGKENQKHYKFCLGCGTELYASVKSDAPLSQDGASGSTNVIPKGPPPGVSAPPKPLDCNECGAEIPINFKFCGACGAPAPKPEEANGAGGSGKMTLIKPDGTEGGELTFSFGETTIGRDHGELFVNDGYLSPSHCVLEFGDNGCVIKDNESLNGVFSRMVEPVELVSGQFFRIGQELLRFDQFNPSSELDDGTEIMGSPNPGYWGKITVVVGDNMDGAAFPLAKESVSLGRERGDINFPDDGYVSGLHAKLYAKEGRFFLEDLGSSNGTFTKIESTRHLPTGTFILLGQQLFRVDY